jgi:multidrug efflux pump subunit AcrA (membrane-fusion protein)
MTIARRQDYERTYSIRNASGIEKKLIIEHPITQGTSLGEPANYDERTPSLYRFNLTLPANRELQFKVGEETPVSERITLARLRPDTFLSYTTNQEIPANVRSALLRAIELRRIADEAATSQTDLENQRTRLVNEQDRIRRNLEAAGNQTPQGQEYLSRLASLDRDIDAVNAQIASAALRAQQTRNEYDNYLANLNL